MINKNESAIWENTDGCVEQYRCATALYLLSLFSKAFNRIIYTDVSAPGHGKKVADRINATYKSLIFHLMSNLQLTSSRRFDTKTSMHTSTNNADMILAQEIQKDLSKASRKRVILDIGKHKRMASKQNWTNR